MGWLAVPIVVFGLSVIILFVAGVLIAIVRHEAYTPKPPRHTPDCLDWRRHGQRDITCTARHGTDWFGPRAQVELENAFDGQIGVHRG